MKRRAMVEATYARPASSTAPRDRRLVVLRLVHARRDWHMRISLAAERQWSEPQVLTKCKSTR